MNRRIFHLAFPVQDLAASRAFYVEALGAVAGRDTADWIDIILWGHQLTLHHKPEQVLTHERRGVRHFGVILPWPEWQATLDRLVERGVALLSPPVVRNAGTSLEQGKFYLEDPSGNVIEIKAYRDLEATFGVTDQRHRLGPA